MNKKMLMTCLVLLSLVGISALNAFSNPAPSLAPAPKSTTALSAAPAATPAAKTFKFVATSGNPEADAMNQWWKWIMDQFNARSKGRVTITMHWAAALAKNAEELDVVGRRTADLNLMHQLHYPTRFRAANLTMSVPFGPDTEIVWKAARDTYYAFPNVFKKEFEANNLHVTPFFACTGTYVMNMVKPIKSMAELKGIKIGVLGTAMPKWVTPSGATPVSLPGTERYQAMQSGVLGGHVFPAENLVSWKFNEVAPNIFRTNFGAPWTAEATWNRQAWNELPPDLQKLWNDICLEAQVKCVEFVMAEIKSVEDAYIKQGGTVTTLSDAEKAAWAAGMDNLPEMLGKDLIASGYPEGMEMMKFYLRAAAKYGYKSPREWIK